MKGLTTNKNIILASASPRRHHFLKELGLDFQIKLKPVDEVYPDDLKGEDITNFLAKLKADPFLKELQDNDILVTADTIVWLNNQAIGKPKNPSEAKTMLKQLSGQCHEVISSFSITTKNSQITKHQITKVYFNELTQDEIDYYIDQYAPYDKAGSYGIQEWIGYIGIEKIEGCFYNVMGFPVRQFYQEIKSFL